MRGLNLYYPYTVVLTFNIILKEAMIAVKLASLTSWYCWLCWHCCHLQFGTPEAVPCHHSWRAGISRRITNHNRIGICCCSSSYAHGEKDNSRSYYNLGRWSLEAFLRKLNRPTLRLLRKLRSGGTFDDTISRGCTVHVDDSDGAESWKERGWDDSGYLLWCAVQLLSATYNTHSD